MQKSARLYFIDAIRAWAILMMLQGHFIDGLLDPVFRDDTSWVYNTWKYFRGITAPVFFTVSGFIFTYLLTRGTVHGIENPRIKKGFKRGIELVIIGYLLRLNILGLFKGQIYGAFFLVDVLHCIGISLLFIIALYLLSFKSKKVVFPILLITAGVLLFLFEPQYKQHSFSFLPEILANYFSKENGSVFTIIPWIGYTAIGGFASTLFTKYKNVPRLYFYATGMFLVVGYFLIYHSSLFFLSMSRWTNLQFFNDIVSNNYLFIRLGNVFLVFAIFIVLERFLKNKTLLKTGQSTLSIYSIHFIILYGSFFGIGLYRYFNHELTPTVTIIGAIAFMAICTFLALKYEIYKTKIKSSFSWFFNWLPNKIKKLYSIPKKK